jgi:hypothetical protein
VASAWGSRSCPYNAYTISNDVISSPWRPRRALPGLNSAAVGLVVAAAFQLYDTARRASPFPETSVAIGMIGFTFVEIYKQQVGHIHAANAPIFGTEMSRWYTVSVPQRTYSMAGTPI